MKITTVFINFIIFSFVLIGISSFYGAMMTSYMPLNATSNFTANVVNITNYASNQQGALQNQSGGIASVFTTPALVWDALMSLFDMPGMILSIFNEISTTYLGSIVPGWFLTMVTAVVAIWFLFKIIGIITSKEI